MSAFGAVGFATYERLAHDHGDKWQFTFPFGLAPSFGPNFATNTLSVAFLTSRGFAHRSWGVALSALMTGPRLAHADILFEDI